MNILTHQSETALEFECRLEKEYAQSAEQDRIICAEFDRTLMDGLEDEDWE